MAAPTGYPTPAPVEWSVPGYDSKVGSMDDEPGRQRLREHVAYEVYAARGEAAVSGNDRVDPVLKGIVAARSRYEGSDPDAVAHLTRMAAMSLELPYSARRSGDLLEFFGDDWGKVDELIKAREALDSLPTDPADREFGIEWFEAWIDLGTVLGRDPLAEVG